jgi:hypothetical protein
MTQRFLEATTVIRRLLFLAIGFAVLSEVSGARAEIQVGAAARVITQDPLLPVSGRMGAPRPAREKRGELTARAMVVRKGEVTVAVVALDLLGFPSVLGDRVRAKVDCIPSKTILVGSTHTHSAPDCYAFPDGQGGHTGDLSYMDFVCDKERRRSMRHSTVSSPPGSGSRPARPAGRPRTTTTRPTCTTGG